VYQKTWQRVVAREGEAETRSMVAPPSIKLARSLSEVRTNFGLPLLALAGIGAVALVRHGRRDALTLVLTGWTATWLAFVALGVLTAIEMRANLAATPAILALAVYGLVRVSEWRGAGPLLATVAVIAIVAEGVSDWMMCLTGV
jgi:ActR/RegA family two-component response regulator